MGCLGGLWHGIYQELGGFIWRSRESKGLLAFKGSCFDLSFNYITRRRTLRIGCFRAIDHSEDGKDPP